MAPIKKRSRKTKSEPKQPVELSQTEVDQLICGDTAPKAVVQRIRRSRPSRAIGRLDAKDKEKPVTITRAEMGSIVRRGGTSKSVQARFTETAVPERSTAKTRTKRTSDQSKRPRKKPPAASS